MPSQIVLYFYIHTFKLIKEEDAITAFETPIQNLIPVNAGHCCLHYKAKTL